METVKHPDGIWNTSEHGYRDRRILIKSRKGYGMKGHVFLPDSDRAVITLRYSYIAPSVLLTKLKRMIDVEREY